MSGWRASSAAVSAPRPGHAWEGGPTATSGSSKSGVTWSWRPVTGRVTRATSSSLAETAAAISGALPVTTMSSSSG